MLFENKTITPNQVSVPIPVIHVSFSKENNCMKTFALARVLTLSTALLFAGVAQAQTDVTPNLSGGVGSFYTDRYNPASFAVNSGTVQGRSNVLQIGINSSTDALNRPAGLQGQFYNTQGRKLDVNQGGSWTFQSDLFVESGWSSPSSGLVRTDMWATQCNGTSCIPNSEANVTNYPIIGFTNQGAAGARFRGWNGALGWQNFNSTVNFGQWNTLTMSFDDLTNTLSYLVNGVNMYSYTPAGSSTVVGNIMYQAYNWNDATLNGQMGNADYIANWSNTPGTVIPEPSTYALMATGLVGLFGIARRRNSKNPA